MKKSKWFLCSAISGLLSAVSLVIGIIVTINLPSTAAYEVAQAFGDTAQEDILFALNRIMGPLFIVFAITAVVLLIVGKIRSRNPKP